MPKKSIETTSEAADNLASLLNEIQVKLDAPKSQHNSHGNYKYRKCEDILQAIKPFLKASGAILLIKDDIVLIGDRYYVKATAKLLLEDKFTETTAYARECLDRKGMDLSQITGATSSYARKYALNGLFCIDDNQDADTREKPEAKKPKEKLVEKTPEQPAAPAKESIWMTKLKGLGKVIFKQPEEFKAWRTGEGYPLLLKDYTSEQAINAYNKLVAMQKPVNPEPKPDSIDYDEVWDD